MLHMVLPGPRHLPTTRVDGPVRSAAPRGAPSVRRSALVVLLTCLLLCLVVNQWGLAHLAQVLLLSLGPPDEHGVDALGASMHPLTRPYQPNEPAPLAAEPLPTNTPRGPTKQRTQPTASAPVVPKVALLFLAPLGPANEGVWRAFLESAAHVSSPQRMGPALASMPAGLQQALRTGPGVNLTRLVGGPLHPPLIHPTGSQPAGAEATPGSRLRATATDAARVEQRPAPRNRCQCTGSCWGSGGRAGSRSRAVAGWRCRVVSVLACAARLAQGCGCCGSLSGRVQGPGEWEQHVLEEEVTRLLAPASGGGHVAVLEAQSLFSVYVHTLPGHRLPSTSVFTGLELARPVDTRGGYAQPALMEAARALLAAAWPHPANVRFVLLSDTTLPLLPPGLLWAALLSNRKSRVDACPGPDDDAHRCRPELHSTHVRCSEHWRKSSQWWCLGRGHAGLVVTDTHVAPLFTKHCVTRPAPHPPCCCVHTTTTLLRPAPFMYTVPSNSSSSGSSTSNSRSGGSEYMCDVGGAQLLSPRCVPTNATHTCCTEGQAQAAARKARMGRSSWQAAAQCMWRGVCSHNEGAASTGPVLCKRAVQVCVADEHYVPTLLASYRLDSQTDCVGLTTYADWTRSWGSSHPHTFQPWELGPDLTTSLRHGHDPHGRLQHAPTCDWGAARAAAARGLFAGEQAVPLTEGVQSVRTATGRDGRVVLEAAENMSNQDHTGANSSRGSGRHGDAGVGISMDLDVDAAVSEWVTSTGFPSLPLRCSLFARKFGGRAVGMTAAVGAHAHPEHHVLRTARNDESLPKHEEVGEDETAVLRWALSCDGGLGLGWWCVQRGGHGQEKMWGL